jgi:membrane protein
VETVRVFGQVHVPAFFVRLWQQIARDRLSLVAAGVAFYWMLAFFPALAALVALYGLAFDARQVNQQVAALEGLIPQQALELALTQLQALTRARSSLGWGAAAGALLALWSASRGVKTLMEALNVAYGEREERGFLRRNGVALLLTLGTVVGSALAIAAIVLLPMLAGLIGLEPLLQEVLAYARWPILAVAVAGGVALMYRYGPSRERPGWRVIGRGALIATALWLGASLLFSLYVSSFDSFNRAYGAIAGLVVLLVWFLVSAYAILLGAEINAELERTKRRRSHARAGEAERAV